MAKDKEIPISTKVKVDSKEAKQKIEEFGEKVEKLRKKSRGTATGATKDWAGFANLFSTVLPRNVQMMIRKFQSTQRAVGRLSRGLKFLKGAFAGLGIGLLLIALETLISRWDDITRLLSGVTKEQERYNERIKAGTKALEEYNTRNAEYIRIVNDTTEETDLRSEALSNLATSLREVRDLDIESADGLERFNKAIERQLDLVRIQNEEQTLLNQIADLRIENNEAEASWFQRIGQDMFRRDGAAGALEEKRAGIQAQMNTLIADYQKLQKDRLELEAQTTAELDRQAAEQERLRLLEQARLKYGKDWEFQMQQMEEANDEMMEAEMDALLDEFTAEREAREEHQQRLNEIDEEGQRLATQLHNEEKRKRDEISDYFLRKELERLDGIAQARNANFRAAEKISTQLERLAEDGSNAQKAFAVTSVLLSQAQAVQSAITGALKAAEATNAAAPFTAPLFIAQMVGLALSSFAQVKGILQQAGASTGGAVQRGGGRGGQTQALVPQGTSNRQQQLPQVNQSYVVQSQLQGMMHLQSSLEKRLHL